MRIIGLALAISICSFSCQKDKPFRIDASKINFVDENGVSNGDIDPSDWRFDDDWKGQETALFNFADTVSTIGMQKAFSCSADATPNPSSAVMMLSFSADKPTLLKIVVTDEYLNIISKRAVRLEQHSIVNPNIGIGIDVRNARYIKGGYYRVYYAFYAFDGLMYKRGHGDFQKL